MDHVSIEVEISIRTWRLRVAAGVVRVCAWTIQRVVEWAERGTIATTSVKVVK
jgi:hypothetical protein